MKLSCRAKTEDSNTKPVKFNTLKFLKKSAIHICEDYLGVFVSETVASFLEIMSSAEEVAGELRSWAREQMNYPGLWSEEVGQQLVNF